MNIKSFPKFPKVSTGMESLGNKSHGSAKVESFLYLIKIQGNFNNFLRAIQRGSRAVKVSSDAKKEAQKKAFRKQCFQPAAEAELLAHGPLPIEVTEHEER